MRLAITPEELDYRIALQIHDSIMLLVPVQHVPEVIDVILPECMSNAIPIYPCHLDGEPNGDGPYYLGIDAEISTHWGEPMLPDECEKLGVDPKYAGWKQSESGLISPENFPRKIWHRGALHDAA